MTVLPTLTNKLIEASFVKRRKMGRYYEFSLEIRYNFIDSNLKTIY